MYLGVEILRACSWDVHIAKAIGKGEAHVGNMDAILTDSHRDTINRMKICIMVVIVPKLEYAEVWEENTKLVRTARNSTDGSS